MVENDYQIDVKHKKYIKFDTATLNISQKLKMNMMKKRTINE